MTANKLTVTTPSDREVVLTRVFDAPRERVFEAHSTCEHVKRWWARGNPMDCELDFRVGGKYRFIEHSDEGEFAFRGEYREISAPEVISYTFEWEGRPGHICVDRLVFTEEDGKTLLTSTTTFDSVEDRDSMLQSGMADGASQAMDRLDEILAQWS